MWNASKRFVLELVVIDDGAVAGHDLGDRVREVGPLAEERFDDGDLASASGHDQVAGCDMTGCPGAPPLV